MNKTFKRRANVCPGQCGVEWISCIIWRESKCSFWHPLLSINEENQRAAFPFPSRHCGLMSEAPTLICVSNGKDTQTLSASFTSSVSTVQPNRLLISDFKWQPAGAGCWRRPADRPTGPALCSEQEVLSCSPITPSPVWSFKASHFLLFSPLAASCSAVEPLKAATVREELQLRHLAALHNHLKPEWEKKNKKKKHPSHREMSVMREGDRGSRDVLNIKLMLACVYARASCRYNCNPDVQQLRNHNKSLDHLKKYLHSALLLLSPL